MIHPQARTLLDMMAQRGLPLTHELTLHAGCTIMLRSSASTRRGSLSAATAPAETLPCAAELRRALWPAPLVPPQPSVPTVPAVAPAPAGGPAAAPATQHSLA
jgi:hypothetical protein